MKITVIGTGYVGLVTGACLAEVGNNVTCVDINQARIENLHRGILPIYEPGLDKLVINNTRQGKLRFTTSLSEAMDAEIFFIAVGTPEGEDGSADLKYVLEVAAEIGTNIKADAIVINKSTVPVGTAEKVKAVVLEQLDRRGVNYSIEVVSNPEFLKEGDAVEDFMRPDRIIIGCENRDTKELLSGLYMPFNRKSDRIIFMSVRAAEMTKYASNCMLATKISFINEIANLCDIMHVDVESVRLGIGSDSRIGYSFIYPGCGYGGSCFPKDVKAMIKMADQCGYDTTVLKAVEARNYDQKLILARKIRSYFGDNLAGLTFGIWGLAFKPGTDDMREASSIVLITELIQAGACVKAYDPVAMETARRFFPNEYFISKKLELAEHQYDAVRDADAMVLVTEWNPFRYPDFDLMQNIMKNPVIFDGRNQYDPELMKKYGFDYIGIGRGWTCLSDLRG